LNVKERYNPLPQVVEHCAKETRPEWGDVLLAKGTHDAKATKTPAKAQKESNAKKRSGKQIPQGNANEHHVEGFPSAEEEKRHQGNHIGQSHLDTRKGQRRGETSLNHVENDPKSGKETDSPKRYRPANAQNLLLFKVPYEERFRKQKTTRKGGTRGNLGMFYEANKWWR